MKKQCKFHKGRRNITPDKFGNQLAKENGSSYSQLPRLENKSVARIELGEGLSSKTMKASGHVKIVLQKHNRSEKKVDWRKQNSKPANSAEQAEKNVKKMKNTYTGKI